MFLRTFLMCVLLCISAKAAALEDIAQLTFNFHNSTHVYYRCNFHMAFSWPQVDGTANVTACDNGGVYAPAVTPRSIRTFPVNVHIAPTPINPNVYVNCEFLSVERIPDAHLGGYMNHYQFNCFSDMLLDDSFDGGEPDSGSFDRAHFDHGIVYVNCDGPQCLGPIEKLTFTHCGTDLVLDSNNEFSGYLDCNDVLHAAEEPPSSGLLPISMRGALTVAPGAPPVTYPDCRFIGMRLIENDGAVHYDSSYDCTH